MEEKKADFLFGDRENPQIAGPNYFIEKDSFKIRNYGDHFFYPNKSLVDGLKESIIFTESNKKRDIPNGSVFLYDSSFGYKPEILGDDVGCGISAAVTERIEFPGEAAKSILSIIEKEKIYLGRGNHFINISSSHPSINYGSMIFLHTDFNQGNKIPKNFDEAFSMQEKAKNRRIETLDVIIRELGVFGEFYKDWTHNSVKVEDGNVIYRKGAIDVRETGGEGILALNPFDGIYFYISDWDDYYSSMQHATGKRNLANTVYKGARIKMGKSQALVHDGQGVPENLYAEYNNMDPFLDKFALEQYPIGESKPEVVIKTK